MRKLKTSELNRLSEKDFESTRKKPIIILLDNVRSSHNVGSAFRSADAFLIEKICLCGITAFPPHKDIYKTALGAENTIKWEHYEQSELAVIKYKNLGYQIIAIEQTDKSTNLVNFQPNKEEKYVLVFGHEVKGVDQETLNLCDYSLEIPQFGTKHSLNVSVCMGIILWEFSKSL